ncbi:hypothetical protein ABPG74_009399 [Tetrahymena malaccensis]
MSETQQDKNQQLAQDDQVEIIDQKKETRLQDYLNSSIIKIEKKDFNSQNSLNCNEECQQIAKENINEVHQINQNDAQTISIFKIQKCFYYISQQQNLVNNLKIKAGIQISEFEIFIQNLETILNCNAQNIDCIKQLGQKLAKEYVRAFNASSINNYIQEYMSDPKNIAQDQVQIKQEFIRFSNEKKFQELIEDDTDYESDPYKIFDQYQDQILNNQFQDIQQVKGLSQNSKKIIHKEYSESKLSEMVNIYQKIQSIKQGNRPSENLQKPIEENQNLKSQRSINQTQTPSENNDKSQIDKQIISFINNKNLNNQQELQKNEATQQTNVNDINTKNQNVLYDNKAKPEDKVFTQTNETKQNDEENQRKISQKSKEQEEIITQLKQKLKPGEYAPKKIDIYNSFIEELAKLLLLNLPSQSIEEHISEYIVSQCHVNKTMELISEIIKDQQNSKNNSQIIKKIQEQIPLFKESLNDEEIQQMIQQMRIEGFQSSLYKKYNFQNRIIEDKIFDIHKELPFLNQKTFQVCQKYFKLIDFLISDQESKLIVDQYFIKVQQYQEEIKNNIEKFKLIEQQISSNAFIRKYIEQIFSLSLKKNLHELFKSNEAVFNDKFIIKKIINQDNSTKQLQKLVEKYQIDKTLEYFQILEQIFQENQFNSLYFKSLLLVEINMPKYCQQLYFSQTFQFLVDVQTKGLKTLSTSKYQSLINLLQIDQNISNVKDFENIDQYYIQLLQFACSEKEKKIELIQFVLRKQLSSFQINEDQLDSLSKQIHKTGLVFISQLNEQRINFGKDIDQKLSKCKFLQNIYGRNLYELEDQSIKFYFDFESQLSIQNQRDTIFKIDKCIDLNQLLEYHNSSQKATQVETWIKDIADLYTNQDPKFSSMLYDLIIYLSKRNQNLDIVFQKLQEHLINNQSKQNRFIINKKIVFEYLMEYSNSQAQFKLTLMLGFANPVPLLRTKLIKIKENEYKFQQQLQYQSFWLLKQQDFVVASLGIGYQKGKSSLLNDLFATNFAISDDSYSFIQSADIQSNHIFQQNKRKYFVADFHGDASLLDVQYILGFFVYYILQVNISQIQNNKMSDLERIIKILEKNNKKYCILVRDFEGNSQSWSSYIKNSQIQNEIIVNYEKYNLLTLPNLKLIDEEKKKYHLNKSRITLDNLINREKFHQSSLNLFIENFFPQENSLSQIKNQDQTNNQLMYQTFQNVNQICDKIQQSDEIQERKLFYVYSAFSKYKKTLMEYSDRKFKNSTCQEIQERGKQFEIYKQEYSNLKITDENQRSQAIKLFEAIICKRQNLYHNMLFFIQKLKDINYERVGQLKQEKRNLIASKEKDQIQKMQQLDQQILDNQISIELFWREIIQLWKKHPTYSKNNQLIEAYATLIYNGFPFEIIDGETFYYPFDFLQKCFEQNYFTDKKFCIISIIGPQNSGKSTLLNYFLGCDFYVSDGRCTRGIYGTLVKSKIPEFDYILVIDSEGLLSQEKDDPDYDRMLTLFCLSVSQFLIINVKDQLTPEMTKILELCVEVSSDLKANQIPKRVVEIVFNQKADPNNENNKVAINKALKSFEQNAKISDHIEINHENASNLPTAFSYKYIDLGQQQQNWNYLETQITFVEGVQNLGDKIIQKLIYLSQQEQQKSFKIVKSIPELLKLMKNIYKTIKQNSDLTAFKDVLHKQNDQQVKQFIKKMINQMMDERFTKSLSDIYQDSKQQNENSNLQNIINDHFDYLEDQIKQNIYLEFKDKIQQEIIIQNINYLNQQIQIQKDNHINNIYQDKQLNEQGQLIQLATEKILSLAKEQTDKSKEQQISIFNTIFSDEIEQIKKKYSNQQQNKNQSFQFIQSNYKLYLPDSLNYQPKINYDDEKDIDEITKIGFGLVCFKKKAYKNQQFDQIAQDLNYPLIQSKLLYKIYQIFCIRLQFCQIQQITFQDIGCQVQQYQQIQSFQRVHYNKYTVNTQNVQKQKFMLDAKEVDQLLNKQKEYYGIIIDKSFIYSQYSDFSKPTDYIDFSNIGDYCEIQYNLKKSDQDISIQDELNKMKQNESKYLSDHYKKWYDYFAFWTTPYDKRKNELEKFSQCNYLKVNNSSYNCFISWLKQQLKNLDCSIILNFKIYIQNINNQIKQNINNQKISKIDKELISKIASIIQKNIQEANQNLNIFELELSAQAENRLNMLAIQQLYEQDMQNKELLNNHPIKQFESSKSSYQNYFLEYAQKDQIIDKQSAIQFQINIFNFCQNMFQKISNSIIDQSLKEYQDQLSKKKLIKQIQSQFFNITEEEAYNYIQDPNKIIFQKATQLSQQYLEQIQQKLDQYKKKLINQVEIILKSLQNIKTNFLFDTQDKKGQIASQIFIKQPKGLPSIQQSHIAFQKFIFQILSNEEKEIEINGTQIIVDLQRPQYLQINCLEAQNLLIQFINQNQSFFNQMQIKSIEIFSNQLEEIIMKEKMFENINKFQTIDIKKEFSTINDYLTCDFKCPCCAQVCDQDHWKYNQEPRGKGINKHTIKCGHRFAAFNGVKIEKENIPALITCQDYQDETSVKYQGQLLKWGNFKEIHDQWDWNQGNSSKKREIFRQFWQKLWSLIGKKICQNHNIKYEEICTPQIIEKCKSQIKPIHFIIAFDESGSMNGKNWQDLRNQLQIFINLRYEKSVQDVCSLIGFDDKVFNHTLFETISQQIFNKIPINNHGGGTNYSIIFNQILQLLNHQRSKDYIENTIIFFLSDGVAGIPNFEINQMLMQSKFIKEIQFVGYGNHDFSVLQQMVNKLQSLNASFQKVLNQDQLSKQFQNLSLIIPN